MKLKGRRQSKNVIDATKPEGRKKLVKSQQKDRLLSKEVDSGVSKFQPRKKNRIGK